jgi:hypothetical protein
MMQPFLKLTPTEPYRCAYDARQTQLESIQQTLKVAALADHGAGITHFTIFPEYSIPGMDGVRLIEAAITDDDWPCGTVVIGGIDALDSEAYTELCTQTGSFVNERNAPSHVGPSE